MLLAEKRGCTLEVHLMCCAVSARWLACRTASSAQCRTGDHHWFSAKNILALIDLLCFQIFMFEGIKILWVKVEPCFQHLHAHLPFWPRCLPERSLKPLCWRFSDFSPKLAINPWKLDFSIRTIKNAYLTHRGHSSLCHWGFLEATLRPFRGWL